jgi:hypothetical protein
MARVKSTGLSRRSVRCRSRRQHRSSVGRRYSRYTDQGRQDQFKNHVLHQAVPAFHQGRRAISRAKQELEDKRHRLQLPKANPTDAAGAVARMEIRTWLRSLPQAERDKLTRDENIDQEIRAAIIEAPR